ncbi:MAG: ferredoxin reductase [Deltaproteobacteria bacterium]|nr:ferredoxin reductase [Deltaproteobacteria bacterium]
MLTLRDAALPDRHWVDFVLQHLDPTLGLTRNRGRIVAIRSETPDTKTFVLRPARPVAFSPGQFVPVRIVLGGVVHERPYSPTSRPGTATLSITVKRHPGGTVSGWLHELAAVGDVVEIGEPAGDFVLPASFPARLLFVAGGSGITAVYAVLRAALWARHEIDASLLYYARGTADFAFASELRALEERHPALRVQLLAQQPDGGGTPAGHISPAQLDALVPDHLQREVFACGPATLLEAVSAHWSAAGRASRLHRESFAPPAGASDDAGHAAVPVQFRRSARTVDGDASTLLAIAEAAGLRPATGCRMGICRTCTCTKIAGRVRDRVTGAIDDAPMSRIRLCVSEPLGPITLDL